MKALMLLFLMAQGNAAVSLPDPAGYRLWSGDVIEIRFFYAPELNNTLQIRPDGRVAMPLVGEIEVSNRTVSDVSSTLEKLYSKELKNPAVTIYVRSYASQKIYVGGEVQKPGAISLIGNLSMFQAIMEAGGIRNTGNSREAILIRKGDDGLPVTRHISLRNTRDEPSGASSLMLVPFDVVLVPETKITHLDGWIDQHVRQLTPGIFTFGFSYLINGGVVR